ncbi:MAG TPA: hypothetical protein H9776_05925 [Candidatus Mediterraneibacter intestinipullorum]|nr:hypothetical protein [Candidatus Mediterraneibacter intestinipullorum]
MKVEEKIRYIAEHNGLEKALDKLAEECAEYAAARIKHNLGEDNGEYLEELADVFIMRAEVQLLMPEEMKCQISEEINRKLDRQIERIQDEISERNKI